MAIRNRGQRLLVVAVLGSAMTSCADNAVAQYVPHFGKAFKALIGKSDERKVVGESHEIPAQLVTEKNYAQVQLAIGDSLAKDGNLEGAQSAYEAAIRNDATFAGAYHHLARLHEKLGHGNDSKTQFQKALELEPNNAEIVCDYGYWCYLRQDWAESHKQYERVLKLDPASKRAHNNLALLYARTGHSEEAMQQFGLAGLTEAEARTNLGYVYLTERRVPEAKSELQRAIARNPRSDKARSVLASLEKAEKKSEPTRLPAPTIRTTSANVPEQAEIATPSTVHAEATIAKAEPVQLVRLPVVNPAPVVLNVEPTLEQVGTRQLLPVVAPTNKSINRHFAMEPVQAAKPLSQATAQTAPTLVHVESQQPSVASPAVPSRQSLRTYDPLRDISPVPATRPTRLVNQIPAAPPAKATAPPTHETATSLRVLPLKR